ncbi:DNA polymerase III subunit chi [Pseudidiomarina terrestris]|uniref:DNA polymerase III subunit chi n=1 Tax=Pseudidiomarina terrestris TaxID=2820060 RepID=A0AAW7QVP1_9GAMM|nr:MULTISPECIES: DNA polymerase III subunit chi [unclassified Pseudidiomarina]MDN7123824.1 DNA polymerase III subunit chi [Pseudidiomarina sp. 1APP75-32.1]MDN7127578.1 DNA polymerase III subunit chi [Pseudidiomarina sp. 1APR75-33.1]MDN7130324.1 DNA polymerase III subunit chi [Pseudidiomarina sp. 1APR75-15]MDN7136247.1 DNA polymerase III subunit chi [Pseudidiomarina sp. 1ASP75-5]MDN7138836.1 DNA polymerase III subunit chi [Pseudidiomarina sp. 1ASP75-14]
MVQGIFYVLDGLSEEQQLQFFCQTICERWREFGSVRVWCRDQQHAEMLDEALWQQPADAFVPHNLVGEGPPYGAPVELCWPTAAVSQRRCKVSVNFMPTAPQFAGAQLIVDQVPSAPEQRQEARERFKWYRQQGVNLSTVNVAETATHSN